MGDVDGGTANRRSGWPQKCGRTAQEGTLALPGQAAAQQRGRAGMSWALIQASPDTSKSPPRRCSLVCRSNAGPETLGPAAEFTNIGQRFGVVLADRASTSQATAAGMALTNTSSTAKSIVPERFRRHSSRVSSVLRARCSGRTPGWTGARRRRRGRGRRGYTAEDPLREPHWRTPNPSGASCPSPIPNRGRW